MSIAEITDLPVPAPPRTTSSSQFGEAVGFATIVIAPTMSGFQGSLAGDIGIRIRIRTRIGIRTRIRIAFALALTGGDLGVRIGRCLTF